MATFLKHTPTGDLYPYNEDMAKDKDMVPCDPKGETKPVPPPAEPAPAVPVTPIVRPTAAKPTIGKP